MVLAKELSLSDSITLDYSVVPHPTLKETLHSRYIPSGKIPALLVDDKIPIYGSENICQYLNMLSGSKVIF